MTSMKIVARTYGNHFDERDRCFPRRVGAAPPSGALLRQDVAPVQKSLRWW